MSAGLWERLRERDLVRWSMAYLVGAWVVLQVLDLEDIDDTLARLGERGAELVGEVVRYQDIYRLCYIQGPEGILIGLAEALASKSAADSSRRPTSRTSPA